MPDASPDAEADGPLSAPDASPSDGAAPGGDLGLCVRATPASPGEVLIATGVVRGVADGNTYAYKGIPFAAPPTGPLRFAPPAPPACWGNVRDASTAGPVCMQFDSQHQNIVGDEDCLTLNLWTPATATASSHLPVLFFIHGGGHQIGDQSELASSVLLYNGRPLVESQNVVLVTANYRLGPLGYLANAQLAAADPHGSTGNYGTLDQIAALKWVQDNIQPFGGDASRVMVFGESAGGEAVCTLLASPLAAGLFSSAVSESGPCLALALDKAESYGDTVVSAVGCTGDADVPACLRGKSASDLVQTEPGPGDTQVIATFGGYWASLAASGDPNGTGRVAWEAVRTGNDALVVIDATVTTDSRYHNTQCDFWASLGQQATPAP